MILTRVVLLFLFAAAALPQGAPPQGGVDQPYTLEYYYKTPWGHQQEFLQLFLKNHYPLLKASVADGRFVSVKTYVPRYHGDGRADWTFAVEIVAKDDAPGGPSEDEVIKKLFPDQATYKKEEQRRFEILEAHWDVPLNGVDLDQRK